VDQYEYWIGKDVDYRSVWQAYEDGLGYIEKFRTMRVHLLQIELTQFPSHLALFNHEVVYKTIKGYFHDFKLYCLSNKDYSYAGPLFLYSVDRGSGIWNFLGEAHLILAFALSLATGKVLGQELDNVEKKLQLLQKYFPSEVDPAVVQNFMHARTPRALEQAVNKLVAQGIQRVAVSQRPFRGDFHDTASSLVDIKQTIVKGDLIMGDNVGRDNIYADRGAIAAGGNAKITNSEFRQVWSELAGNPDLETLARELAELRNKMRVQAVEPEHDIAVGHIAAAETAAKAGDGPTMLQHLKEAGKWALEFATKVGATLTTEIIQKSLGM
jgi:hypothetical protein